MCVSVCVCLSACLHIHIHEIHTHTHTHSAIIGMDAMRRAKNRVDTAFTLWLLEQITSKQSGKYAKLTKTPSLGQVPHIVFVHVCAYGCGCVCVCVCVCTHTHTHTHTSCVCAFRDLPDPPPLSLPFSPSPRWIFVVLACLTSSLVSRTVHELSLITRTAQGNPLARPDGILYEAK